MTLSPSERRQAVLMYVEQEAGRIYAGEVSLGAAIYAALRRAYAVDGNKVVMADYVLSEYVKAGEYEMVTVRLGACMAFQPGRIHAEIVEAAKRVLSSVSTKLTARNVLRDMQRRAELEAMKNNATSLPYSMVYGKHAGLETDRNSAINQRLEKLANEERSRPTSPLWEVKPAKPTKPMDKDSLQKHGLMGRIAIGIVLLCIFLTVTMTGRVIISTTLGKF